MSLLLIPFLPGKTIQHNGSIYRFRVDSRVPNWEESRQYCNDTGSDLVSIESHEELKFVNDTILEMKATEYFIGLRKDDESEEWRWLSGNNNMDPLPWAEGQPSKDGKCAVMYNFKENYGQYNDLPCTRIRRHGYICESPAENNNEEGKFYIYVSFLFDSWGEGGGGGGELFFPFRAFLPRLQANVIENASL